MAPIGSTGSLWACVDKFSTNSAYENSSEAVAQNINFVARCLESLPYPKQRGGKTPFQLAGVELGEDDWVALIVHEMREQTRLSVKQS